MNHWKLRNMNTSETQHPYANSSSALQQVILPSLPFLVFVRLARPFEKRIQRAKCFLQIEIRYHRRLLHHVRAGTWLTNPGRAGIVQNIRKRIGRMLLEITDGNFRGEASRAADLLLLVAPSLPRITLFQQTKGGFPGSPVVFDAPTDLDPALSGQLVNAMHRGVE